VKLFSQPLALLSQL